MKKSKQQFIVDQKGKKHAVILPIREYEELLEDIHDLAKIGERQNEPVTPHGKFVKELKKDGLV